MSQPNDAHESGIADVLQSPWAQGVITGLMTLIPVRDYPRWLRQGIIWAPITVSGIAGAYFVANPQVTEQLVTDCADPDRSDSPKPAEGGKHAAEPSPASRVRDAVRVLGSSIAIGAAVSASMAVATWVDEKIDRGLQRLGIPAPRLVMGIAAGAFTWWSVSKENQRDDA